MPENVSAIALTILFAGLLVPETAHAACHVEGVWEQASLRWDGRLMPPHSRPLLKIVYRGHWIEVGTEANRGKLPQQTEVEKLRTMQTFGGAGTYKTTDDTFTQRIESFSFPSAEGATLTGPCRTHGQFWEYSFSPVGVPGLEGPKLVTEKFRRVR